MFKACNLSNTNSTETKKIKKTKKGRKRNDLFPKKEKIFERSLRCHWNINAKTGNPKKVGKISFIRKRRQKDWWIKANQVAYFNYYFEDNLTPIADWNSWEILSSMSFTLEERNTEQVFDHFFEIIFFQVKSTNGKFSHFMTEVLKLLCILPNWSTIIVNKVTFKTGFLEKWSKWIFGKVKFDVQGLSKMFSYVELKQNI